MFDVQINGPRWKVALIKFFRAVHGSWGLTESKDLVEREVSFDSWMSDTLTFTLRVTASQYGRLAHFVFMDKRFSVLDSVSVPSIDHEIIDLTGP